MLDDCDHAPDVLALRTTFLRQTVLLPLVNGCSGNTKLLGKLGLIVAKPLTEGPELVAGHAPNRPYMAFFVNE
jgi:hypothetical protein